MIPSQRKIPSPTYTPIYLVASLVILIVFFELRRTIAPFFDGFKGGSATGLALAYTGSFFLVGAQFYTVVKRSVWAGLMKSFGGVRPWLNIYIVLSFAGLVFVLFHAGFPYQFNSRNLVDHGLAGGQHGSSSRLAPAGFSVAISTRDFLQ